MSNIWSHKGQDPLLILAPMAGYTDSAFRQLCRSFGADIVFTELISADAIAYGKLRAETQQAGALSKNVRTIVNGKNHATAEMLSYAEEERPIVVQLFGKYPEKFAAAAKWVSDELKPDGIDINMGCPARKVVGSDHGAALLKNHHLAVEIVRAVKENSRLPVSVKTRLGWQDDDEILNFAPKLAEAGIDALTIHGRTYRDGFKGLARWQNIYRVKSEFITSNTSCAVIGNGDVKSRQEAMAMADNGAVRLDGVAIGRASFGNPWIFDKTADAGNLDTLKQTILKHAELAWESKGERGIIEMRKNLLAYTKGVAGAKELRKELVIVKSLAEIKDVIKKIA